MYRFEMLHVEAPQRDFTESAATINFTETTLTIKTCFTFIALGRPIRFSRVVKTRTNANFILFILKCNGQKK